MNSTRLYFNRSKISKILAAVESGTGHRNPFATAFDGKERMREPGILLVGDRGIYIIGNEKRSVSPAKSGLIAYASEYPSIALCLSILSRFALPHFMA